MDTLNRIKRSVANRGDEVFLRSEFDHFGSTAQVGRALRQLLLGGVFVRLGVGVYAKAKPSVLTGKPIPVRPLEVLAPEALNKLGIDVLPSRLAQDYNAGRSTQLPAGIVLNIGKRRTARKLSFNGKAVQYERA
ncbi:S-adenosylhomocysteine hydrolase [Acidovorax sp. SDU_ACID1]|uniref:S-adenosylhomocysteine hydrolase n=1 Tax=Acidovorax sp. SDU_ACID1 TaxID=3136632 RepID=UPI0038737512